MGMGMRQQQQQHLPSNLGSIQLPDTSVGDMTAFGGMDLGAAFAPQTSNPNPNTSFRRPY